MNDILKSHAPVIAYFILEGIKYEIQKFNIFFKHSTALDEKPDEKVKSGQLLVTISKIDDHIYNWLKRMNQIKEGQVLFYNDNGENILRIDFTNAFCISLTREFNASIGISTTLSINYENITLDGISHTTHI